MATLSKTPRRRSSLLSGAAPQSTGASKPADPALTFSISRGPSSSPNQEGRSGARRVPAVAAEESRLALAGLAHDARNMFAALKLYCDLLAEPGVLSSQHYHYADELKLVAQAGGRLVERLGEATTESHIVSGVFSTPVNDLGGEVARNRSILTALAGTNVNLEVECLACPGRVRLSTEDLTRLLVNLVRNACEAMPEGGRIRVTVQQGAGCSFLTRRAATSGPRATVLVCVQDNGPGMPAEVLDRIFQRGFTTKADAATGTSWAAPAHRGIGLSIVRSLAESAGGVVRVVSRLGRGTRFEVELPLDIPARERHDRQEGTRVQC